MAASARTGPAGPAGQPRHLQDNGVDLPARDKVDLVGFDITDDAAGDRTVVSVQSVDLGPLEDADVALDARLDTVEAAPPAIVAAPGRLVFEDDLTPVIAEGLNAGVAQAVDSPRTFLAACGQATNAVAQLGGDLMATYTAGAFKKIGVAVYNQAAGLSWCPTTDSATVASDDKVYGLPACAVWESLLTVSAGSQKHRLAQRWYRVPGIRDVLFLEVQVSPDPSGTGSLSGAVKVNVMMEDKAGRVESCGYDPVLDGVGQIGGNDAATSRPDRWFLRCLSHQSFAHHYSSTLESHYDFFTGVLPTPNVDQWTTTAGQTYRTHLAVSQAVGAPCVFRFALGVGHSIDDAKNAVRNVPNISYRQAMERVEHEVRSYLQLPSDDGRERDAFSMHVHTLAHNLRTGADSWPDRYAYDGTPRRLPMNALGRWNGLWTMDTAFGLLGTEPVAPGVVRDSLDVFFNVIMNQSTGYLRGMPGIANRVQHGAFMFARLLHRYTLATGDTGFATALYDKLDLMHTWWTTTTGYQHPGWPTVRLFTALQDIEIQESSPVTAGGNFPSGGDWTTAMAYDFALQMAALAVLTGNTGDVATWEATADDYRDAIQTYCWDAGQGWFQPTMTDASPDGGTADDLGRFDAVMTYRAFFHLYLGVATPAQAAIMHAKIVDEAIFMGAYGVRTVDARWAGYNPNNWVNGGSRPYYDAALSVGLRRYGYDADADAILDQWTTNQLAKGTTLESINPDTGAGGYARHLLTGNLLMEAYLAKVAPDLLYGVGTSEVT